ncbi:helix-turn-helix transcriptional regulator [Streptomyces sp. SID5910]|uniref:helix-turn-helix transcriptional regulator n=1 Tax=Streptomyces sp. SID5910 TaxID=2690312 RepID=UPI00136BBF68|nr:helix-turn-helix transcriptional regulator [Streptomyces sp. SID5910]MYR44142.1 LuxR family transcriptional regulator [Streptomyces sp. SID5910]
MAEVMACGPTIGSGKPAAKSNGTGHGLVVLDSLNDEATDEQILQGIIGGEPDRELLDFAAGARGDRRMLLEFALGATEEGLVELRGDIARMTERRIPRRVAACVKRHLDDLSPSCRHFVQVAAALGMSFMLEDVSRMLHRSSASLLSPLDEAIVSGIVVADELRLSFSNEFLLQGILESIPAPARGALRREASEHLRSHSAASEQLFPSTDEVCSPAHSLIMDGRATAGIRTAERVLADPHVSTATRLDAEASIVLGHSLLGTEEHERHARGILRERGAGQGDVVTLMASTALSSALWRSGALDEALGLGRAAVRYSDGADPVWRMHALLALAGKLTDLRAFEQAESLIDDAEAGLRALPTQVWNAAPAVVRARLFLQAGRFGDARREAELAVAAERPDAVPVLRPLAHCVLSTVALYVGDLPTAVESLGRARSELASDRTVLPSAQYAWTELRIAVKRDGPQAAVDLFAGKYRDLPTQRSLYVEDPVAAPFLVRLALDVGDTGLERSVLETVDALAADNPGISVVGLGALHANAVAAGDAAALSHIIARSPDPIAVALATEELAKIYRSRTPGGRRSTASLPSSPSQARAEEAIASQLNPVCWAGLSDMERRIAYLVSVGMTNRLIAKEVHLSAHTVNYHLRKIYRKLGINTRVELASGAATYSSRAAIYSTGTDGRPGFGRAGGTAV